MNAKVNSTMKPYRLSKLTATVLMASSLTTIATRAHAADAAAVACAPGYNWAQKLVDDTLLKHPELTALVLHVTPPGANDNIVIASNIWLTGSKSDPDDLAVITTGKTMTETNQAGTKFEVQGPLKNVLGATVGSVATVFPYKAGQDKASLEKKAAVIRQELSKQILNPTNLMEPFPFDPQVAWHTYAQKLGKEYLAKYPDLLIFTLHATPPNRSGNVILTSNIGRVGKPDAVDDIEVAKSGKPSVTLKQSDQRAQIIMPLKDGTGKVIGIFNVLMHNGANKDEAGMLAVAEGIRDDVAKRIPDVSALFEPAHE